MREVPISCGFLAFPVVAATASHFGVLSDILSLFVNGSELLVVTRRDKAATWRTLGTLCRELDWSRSRLIHELCNGLRYRTVPPGHVIDWRHSNVRRWLNVEASEVSFYVAREQPSIVIGPRLVTVGIEVLPPAEPTASVEWATNTTRRLRDEGKIREGATKAELARLLEAEAKTAAQAGRLKRALKHSYLENQLEAWGLFPLK
jgi:hypothetical protein